LATERRVLVRTSDWLGLLIPNPKNTDAAVQRLPHGIAPTNKSEWHPNRIRRKTRRMEWDAPAIILDVRPYGEGDALATVMTEAHGLHRGLAKGGASRAKAGTWQPGNMVQVQWTARLSDQLGAFAGELIHAGAAHAMEDPMSLAMLTAICSVAEGALPEREPLPRIFDGLLHLIPRLPLGDTLLTDLIRWELTVLSDLGYGLDLTACAVTGRTDGLTHVSPKTGRAVTAEGAGPWAPKLLPLPEFLTGATTPGMQAWRDGLRLTGHFLARDAFGHQHRPLPQARRMLYDRVSAEAEKDAVTENAG
jgi:DNA repair protein RecO (recombination protein O)